MSERIFVQDRRSGECLTSPGTTSDDVVVSGKTRTLPTIRNEVGVVEYPDGGRYAVAVFTRSLLPIAVLPQADAVIGTAARLAGSGSAVPDRRS